MTNTQILCFVLGWQGGTLAHVASELGVKPTDILEAKDLQMEELCRRAQAVRFKKDGAFDKALSGELLLKHLRRCVRSLVNDFGDHELPGWLESAQHVCKIVGEVYEEGGTAAA